MTNRAANVPPFEHTNEPLQPERISQAVIGMTRAATPEHLAKPHQRVTLKNTHECQTHFIQDRNHNHVELRPGQSKEVDMVCDELQNLIRLARTDRGFYESGPNIGKPFPPHPVKVIGLGPKQSAVPQTV
jgi:hypothetical protein